MTKASDNQAEETNPVGRPLKFKTVEELDNAIQAYFDACDPHVVHYQAEAGRKENGETIWETRTRYSEQKPYTMTGLARALSIDRGTLLNYSKKAEFFSTVEAARQRCAEYAESQLFGPYANGAKFALTNNYSSEGAEWSDKKAVDHTTKGQPMKALVEFLDDGAGSSDDSQD